MLFHYETGRRVKGSLQSRFQINNNAHRLEKLNVRNGKNSLSVQNLSTDFTKLIFSVMLAHVFSEKS